MNANIIIRGNDMLQAFIDQYASIDYRAAKKELKRQFLADEEANKFTLSAEMSKDGRRHEKSFLGITLLYDARGVQIGRWKACLNKGQKIARKDIIIVFM